MARDLGVRREASVILEKWTYPLDLEIPEHHRQRPKERPLACPRESSVSQKLELQEAVGVFEHGGRSGRRLSDSSTSLSSSIAHRHRGRSGHSLKCVVMEGWKKGTQGRYPRCLEAGVVLRTRR